ncbi:large-conductance mechanosensitive channel protein MscL [Leucothrix pacifica]|uniref:Large-conductance mechanosensitive channel n=1 Tax=Leucothrix pacifica TaxID=1247513 RepID=A0A317C415_9GAMM|nr:large-conductance mechanosensitive channel protein MscL [Leucothrix pacifica]PWQ93047.1 large conductance mechanosensitive channel protein MscL [Leucothrix pacifica]
MGMISEFKEFAMKGNLIDMAAGIIIGAAIGKVVSSLVADVIMPPIGVLMGGVDFTDLAYTIQEAAGDVPAVVIKYGAFAQTLIDFLIVAFAIFIIIKIMNKAQRKKEEEPEETGPSQEELLIEIRDLLKK